MLNLLNFLWKNYAFFLFLILELIAVSMVVSNGHQSAIFAYSSNQIGGSAFNSWQGIVHYFDLGEANKQLLRENNELRKQISYTYLDRDQRVFDSISISDSTSISDSLSPQIETTDTLVQIFDYIGTKVISNSVHKQKNYLMINKGSNQGIKENMGVIGPDGIVGIVYSVSNDFSTVVSLLNTKTRMSAKIKSNNEMGVLQWDGQKQNIAQLISIETYIPIHVGDSIISSGYSHIFPEGLLMGSIQDYHQKKGNNNYFISVKLSTDFSNLQYVSVIRNRFYEEQMILEKSLEEGQ